MAYQRVPINSTRCKNTQQLLFQICMWIARKFNLTGKDARQDRNNALRRACRNGHFHVVQWLVKEFHLTSKDAKTDNYCLKESCAQGHLTICRWLYTHFRLTLPNQKVNTFNQLIKVVKRNYPYRKWHANKKKYLS